ncbi:MAG: hypothetical protein IAA81_04945 [Spirochaetes bacterium]|uniref:Uncharacterized protein n=1 Tax=Candidatus Gallitreponema excrementavium TaxID=2840840 RepID=A0A9D9HPI7_9SPIR|nr:hypothetical protein [Candidatus Gallitreponema excrementavium]
MPSDFEKNKEQELDRYGVWIKSGPQDVNDTTGDTAVNLEPPVELQDLQEKQPVSETPASVDGSIEPESGAETETAEPDETGVQDALEELDLPPLSDFNSLDEETELPVKDEEITEADFEIQPSTEIKTSEGTENTMPEDTGSSEESPHINIVQDDGAASFEDDSLAEPDDDNGSDALPEEQTITVENDWISDKEDVPVWESEKTSHEADLKDAENPENDAEPPESGSIVFAEDRDEFPDFSAFLDESELSQIDNMTPPPRTEKKESSGDGMEEISMDDFGLSDDFSEISLDDFMSDGSSSKAKENQAVFDDTPPLNIDLEFDDEFIEESKKMSRTQTDSDDLLSQFFDDDFGVEIIDESPDLSESSKTSGKTEQTGSTDFDLSEIEGFEMFDDTEASPVSEEKPHEDNISSIGKTEEISLSDFDTESTGSETPDTVKSRGGNDGSEDVTSEFDDILSEIGPSANQGSQSIDKPSSGDINLTVTVEDDEETEEEPEPEMDNLEEEEEEISVPIYIEDAGKTPEPSKPNNAPSPGDFDLSEIEGFEFLDSDSPSKKSEQNETVSEETITQEKTTAEPVVAEDETTAEPVVAKDEITAEPVVTEDETIAEPVVAEDETIAEPVVAEEEITAEPVVAEEETPLAAPDFAEPAVQEEEITADPVVAEEETPLADLDFAEPALQEEEIIAEPAVEDNEITAEPVVAEDETIAEPVVAEDETPLADLDFAEPALQEEEIIAEPAVTEDETIAEPVVAEDETIAEPVVTEDEITAEPVVAEEETPLADLDFAEPALQEEEIIAEPAEEDDEITAEPVVAEDETPLADPDFAEPALQEEETIAEPVVAEDETIAEPVVTEEETPLADLDFAEPALQEDETIAEPVVPEEETPLADPDFAEPALQEEEIIAEPAVEEEKCGTEKEADNNKQEQVEAVNTETADVSDMFLESTGNSENTSETMKDLDIPPALGEPGDKETVEINTPKLDITNPFDDSLENTEGDSDTKENEKVESEENMNNDFDDVKAVEQDLLDTETKDTGSEPALDKTNEETTVLRKIAEELTSIRDEITTLKSELNNLKSVDTTASQVEESVQSGDDAGEVSIPTSQNDSENSGFFADDDTDESIALTGDELNNILTTADFTEEKSGVDEDHPVNDDSGEPEEVKTEDVDEGISDFEKELLENDEKTFDEEKAFEDPAYDTVEPVPITKIEDTNYLDGEDEALPAEELAIDEGEIPEIDFNDEVLVEPEETEISDTIKDLDINAKTPEIDTVTQEPTEEKEPEVEKEDNGVFTEELKGEIKTVLAYMDQLLENLPESKIEEFAKSEHFHVYKKLFDELGLS